MPQKLGKGGHGQQNYVPAGYGEASGTYGDNPTGSNKFVKFEKPDTSGEVVKQENKETKKEARTSELKPKQIYEIGNYVRNNWLRPMENLDRIVKNLRWYGGTFGDLSNFTDDELKSILKDLYNNGVNENTEMVYFKKPNSSKWFLTRDKDLLDKAGIKYYTSEEKAELEREENKKLIEKSQTKQDKEIQSIMGEKCLVCFGKGYDKSELDIITRDIKIITDDFPELKNDIKMMGDRNNLEKLINAQIQNQELTEEQIQKEVEKLKKCVSYYNLNGEELENKYRNEAIKRLKKPIQLTKMNRALAYWSPSESALIYMGKMKKWQDENSEHTFDVNWNSSNKPNGVMCHELGHAIHTSVKDFYNNKINELASDFGKQWDLKREYQTFESKIRDLSEQNYSKSYKEEYDRLFEEKYGKTVNYNSWDRKKYEISKEVEQELKNKGVKKYNLSKYATTNLHEFIAESFAAYYTDMKNPLADQVVEEYKNIIKKLREA